MTTAQMIPLMLQAECESRTVPEEIESASMFDAFDFVNQHHVVYLDVRTKDGQHVRDAFMISKFELATFGAFELSCKIRDETKKAWDRILERVVRPTYVVSR